MESLSEPRAIFPRTRLVHSKMATTFLSMAFLFTSFAFASPSAFATSLAVSEANLDWSGMSFTTTGTLTNMHLSNNSSQASSGASTTLGGSSVESKFHFNSLLDWSYTTAASSYSNTVGFASAGSSTSNGILQSTSEAGTNLMSASVNNAQAGAFTDASGFLTGSGIGTIAINIPYSLSINLNETQPRSVPGLNDLTTGTASAFLSVSGSYSSDSLSWPSSSPPLNGVLTKSGILTFSRTIGRPNGSFDFPFTVSTGVNTNSTASVVPEPSSFLLLAAGLAGIVGYAWRRRKAA